MRLFFMLMVASAVNILPAFALSASLQDAPLPRQMSTAREADRTQLARDALSCSMAGRNIFELHPVDRRRSEGSPIVGASASVRRLLDRRPLGSDRCALHRPAEGRQGISGQARHDGDR